MQQASEKFLMFRNRLEKVYKHLSKQARRQGVSCFRFYDHDLPEFPFIIEQYEDKLYVSEYQRRHGMDDAAHEEWLEGAVEVMAAVTGVAADEVYTKLRRRIVQRSGQYQKLAAEKEEFVVQEGGLKFIVNLKDYLDTGLFLDHRTTRAMVREGSAGKRVLNLFCYTGSFSVYAAAGGASEVVSVDLSKTYLDWAERNMQLNFTDAPHQTVHADVKAWLKTEAAESADLIVMDPPSFSNSKRMDDVLDVQRDHVELINDCLQLLRPGGLLYFSTNLTSFQLDAGSIHATSIKDITKATTPFDFAGKLKRQCFLVGK
jgi:23S rRNA (cytosine1962-C5)-methyltransferase